MNTTETQDQPCSPQNLPMAHNGPVQNEDDDLNKAIANSYEDQRRMSTQKEPSGNVPKSAAQSTPPRESIEVLMENLALRFSNEFAPLYDVHGDTLIYIGPPSKLSYHNASDRAHIKKHFHRMHQVDSSVLKALGSKKFSMEERQFLGPGCCIRAQKRLKKLDIYEKIDQDVRGGIKFHIDLRPPSEDDDAVLLLTDLTCTHGVRNWYHARQKYQLPVNLVLGTDELDTDSNPYQTTFSGGMPDAENVRKVGASSGVEESSIINLSVPELCPLRQHSAVERMLQAIYGNDPRLDSAPKVWAFFATTSFYDCARHPSISKWIDKWLYTGKNACFIQNNPEVAYRIGMGCDLAHLVRDAYSVLVGEKALLDVVSELGGSVPSSQRSIHGRELENLDDDERNRISHAASSLIRRIRTRYQSMLINMDWLKDCREYKRLSELNIDSKDEGGAVAYASGLIRHFCASRIGHMLSKNLRMPFSDLDASVSNTGAFRNGNMLEFETVYNNLGAVTRPFTRSFWMALQRVQLTEGDYSSSTAAIAELAIHGEAQTVIGATTIHKTNMVGYALSRVNDILWERCHRRSNETGFRPGSPTRIEQPWSRSQLYRPQESYSTSRSSATEYSRAEEKVTPTHLGDHHSSPKRACEPTVDSNALLSGKRRKTLENEDKGVPDQTTQKEGDELAHRLLGSDCPTLDDDGISEIARNERRDSSFRDLQIRLRNSDHAPEPTESLAGSISGISPPSQLESLRPSQPPPKLTVRNPDFRAPEDQQPVHVKREDESGMPVYRMSDDHQAAMRGDKTINSQSSFTPRGTGLAPTFTTTAQAASTTAPTHPHHGNSSSSTAPKPKPKVMQQFSDIPSNMDWSHNRNIDWSEPLPQAPPPRLFNLDTILDEMSRVLARKCDEIVYPPHLFHGVQQTPIDLVDTLVCLDEDEWKFLPLWAGGYDDGEGGVFDEVDVPNDDAAGFKGGKRGIKSKAGSDVEGKVSESESSFDDIADEAMSTVGGASKFATDGTATVRSVNESDTRSDDGFMNQDDVYEIVQAMSIDRMKKGKGKGKEVAEWVPGDEFHPDHDDMPMDDDDDDGDVSTVMGAGSDVHGQFFGDNGTDDGHEQNAKADEHDDSDMEIIDKDKL